MKADFYGLSGTLFPFFAKNHEPVYEKNLKEAKAGGRLLKDLQLTKFTDHKWEQKVQININRELYGLRGTDRRNSNSTYHLNCRHIYQPGSFS